MVSFRRRYYAVVVLFCVFVFSMSVAVSLNVDFGGLRVSYVSIPHGDLRLSGLLYRPVGVSSENRAPAVVLAHGISSAKESMSGIAVELARKGFVALALDLAGHGNSEGRLEDGNGDASLGVLAAIEFLEAQPFVRASAIGLVGHSLGAGAIRAAAVKHANVLACVFVGGGLGGMVEKPDYGVLNLTFPKNLLVAIGTYDVLFNLTQVISKDLVPAFGSSGTVVPGVVYGNFSVQTARKLIVPGTTHLFEPLDPSVVSECVEWMGETLRGEPPVLAAGVDVGFVYGYREVAILIGLAALIGCLLVLSLVFVDFFQIGACKKGVESGLGVLRDRWVLVVWCVGGLLLFFPFLFVGFLVPFPPLIFGGSIAWSLLVVGVLGLVFLRFLAPRFSSVRLRLDALFARSFRLEGLAVAVCLVGMLFLAAYVLERFLVIDLRVLVPVFGVFEPWSRLLMFFVFVPFFFVYFLVDGLFLHGVRTGEDETGGVRRAFCGLGKVVLMKVVPYLLVIVFQYVPFVVFGVPLLGGFAGLLVEFLWLFVPIFVISTVCSWWFHRYTGTIGLGVMFNTLIFAWMAAVVFPF